ncbi:hypothetical protein ES708_08026 [subsurface metagenome]
MPPTSVLCMIVDERIFIATGKPSFLAALAASLTKVAEMVGTTGMPYIWIRLIATSGGSQVPSSVTFTEA